MILFGAMVWDVIWKARNQAQFEGMSPNVDRLIQKNFNYRRAKEIQGHASLHTNITLLKGVV